jgi:hypothetical protein
MKIRPSFIGVSTAALRKLLTLKEIPGLGKGATPKFKGLVWGELMRRRHENG